MLHLIDKQFIMKKLFLALLSIVLLTPIYAQKTEYNVKLNSGLFYFSGKSAEATSFILYSSTTNHSYTNNPYGTKSGLSYGISTGLSRITKAHTIYSIDLGYEVLRSKVIIDQVFDSGVNQMVDAKGETFLNNSFINLYPSIGHRFTGSKISFDLTVGIDFAYHLSSMEKGNATTATKEYTTNQKRRTIGMDYRPRLQLSINKNNTGIYIAYSKGLKNYMAGMTCGTHIVFGDVIRFGIKYIVK